VDVYAINFSRILYLTSIISNYWSKLLVFKE